MASEPKVKPIDLTRAECEKLLYACDTQKQVYKRAAKAENDAVIRAARESQYAEVESIQAKIRNLSLSF